MYYNINFKNLLFDFRSDINYIAWVIISILKSFDCNSKRNSFKDYRKLGLIIELIFRNEETDVFIKFLKNEKLNAYELQILSSCYFKSKLEENSMNTAFIVLEKKEFVCFYKTIKSSNVFYNSCEWINNCSEITNITHNLNRLSIFKDKIYKMDYEHFIKNIAKLKEGNLHE